MKTQNETIRSARKHWLNLAPHVKERDTSRHLLAMVDLAERSLALDARLHEVMEMTPQAMRLQFGELTAGEIRTIRAVLHYVEGSAAQNNEEPKA